MQFFVTYLYSYPLFRRANYLSVLYSRESSDTQVRQENMNSTRNIFRRRISNVRAGLVRSRRNIMSIFHNQQSDEIELSGKFKEYKR